VSSIYHLAEHVVCRQTGGDLRMLFDRRKGVMYEMNETASAVIGCLAERPATFDELLVVLTAAYEAPDDEIRGDVLRLLDDFSEAGLVTAQEP
jgi:hypothetical protein